MQGEKIQTSILKFVAIVLNCIFLEMKSACETSIFYLERLSEGARRQTLSK
jgi:hypothetical protein